MATIDDFLRLELRVGKITEVNDLESRKPMYALKVDVGELGVKNIAAGIKDAYTKDELLNRRVVVVANLEPKSIAGFVSEGMVLAAEDGTGISLLQPDKDLKVGSRVR